MSGFVKEFATLLNAFVKGRNDLSAEQELILIQFLVYVTERRVREDVT